VNRAAIVRRVLSSLPPEHIQHERGGVVVLLSHWAVDHQRVEVWGDVAGLTLPQLVNLLPATERAQVWADLEEAAE
jgi:hypothetical protein